MTIRAVFPGTFDPIHFGHIDIARRGSALFEELVVAVYDRPLKSLLFSPEERMELVRTALADEENITVQGYCSLTVNFCESIGAQVLLRGLRVFSDFEHEFRMALANRRLAPHIDSVSLITSEQHTFLNSTTVREVASLGGDVSSMVPEFVQKALEEKLASAHGSSKDVYNSLRD
ncbi:MAG: pantetheine-phosphate adenylyltransferase [Anaerolineales bacterium]|jgi:pantetheine-phosphate adenylyltransferase|nr:pantetheine-phosphate adenylyltransferase [Anaerolineales bacterium]